MPQYGGKIVQTDLSEDDIKALRQDLKYVDDIIVFHPLQRDQIRQIADLQVRIIADRLAASDMRLEM